MKQKTSECFMACIPDDIKSLVIQLLGNNAIDDIFEGVNKVKDTLDYDCLYSTHNPKNQQYNKFRMFFNDEISALMTQLHMQVFDYTYKSFVKYIIGDSFPKHVDMSVCAGKTIDSIYRIDIEKLKKRNKYFQSTDDNFLKIIKFNDNTCTAIYDKEYIDFIICDCWLTLNIRPNYDNVIPRLYVSIRNNIIKSSFLQSRMYS